MARALLPNVDPESEAFWQACEEERLVALACKECGALGWLAAPCCRRCRSRAQQTKELSGGGSIWTFTRVHHAFHPSLQERVPYVVGLIDLDEGVRMVGRVEAEGRELTIGARVRVRFERREGRKLPYFELEPNGSVGVDSK